jgi:hypothetical protein
MAYASSFLADHVFGMPYHFKWNWWHGAGPVFLDVNRDIGRIAIQTHADSGDRVVSDVHAGHRGLHRMSGHDRDFHCCAT